MLLSIRRDDGLKVSAEALIRGANRMNMMHPEVEGAVVRTLAALKDRPDAATRAALDGLPGLFSSDSHVMEPQLVWQEIPSPFRETVHEWLSSAGFTGANLPAGASDPNARLIDQKRDGVQAEIIFPNNGMAIFGLPDDRTIDPEYAEPKYIQPFIVFAAKYGLIDHAFDAREIISDVAAKPAR
jgi:hypothetical protein